MGSWPACHLPDNPALYTLPSLPLPTPVSDIPGWRLSGLGPAVALGLVVETKNNVYGGSRAFSLSWKPPRTAGMAAPELSVCHGNHLGQHIWLLVVVYEGFLVQGPRWPTFSHFGGRVFKGRYRQRDFRSRGPMRGLHLVTWGRFWCHLLSGDCSGAVFCIITQVSGGKIAGEDVGDFWLESVLGALLRSVQLAGWLAVPSRCALYKKDSIECYTTSCSIR